MAQEPSSAAFIWAFVNLLVQVTIQFDSVAYRFPAPHAQAPPILLISLVLDSLHLFGFEAVRGVEG